MPELPEILLRAREMQCELAGRTIAGLDVLQPKILNMPPEAIAARIAGQRVEGARHRGKWIYCCLSEDVLLINLAFAVAYWLRYDLQWFAAVDAAFYVPYRSFIPVSLALTILLLGIYRLSGVYHLHRGASWFDEAYQVLTSTATGIILTVFVIVFFFRPFLYSRLIFFYAGVLITLFLGLSRIVQRIVRSHLRRKGLGVDRLLIVGAGEIGRTVMRNIVAHPGLGYHIVGFVDDDPEKGNTDIGRFKALGSTTNIARLVKESAIDEVIITLPWMYHRKIVSIIAQCEREKVRVRIVPDIFQMTLSNLDVEDLRIKALMVDGAMKIPRLKPRARGRADRFYHRSCHITVVVTDEA